jgi:hypothetical protein
LSAGWNLTNTDARSRVIRLDGDQTDARSGHPCLAYAPLLLGFGAALPR